MASISEYQSQIEARKKQISEAQTQTEIQRKQIGEARQAITESRAEVEQFEPVFQRTARELFKATPTTQARTRGLVEARRTAKEEALGIVSGEEQKITGAEQQISGAEQQITEAQAEVEKAEAELQAYLASPSGIIAYAQEAGIQPEAVYGKLGKGYASQVMAYKYKTPYGEYVDYSPQQTAQAKEYEAFKEMPISSATGEALKFSSTGKPLYEKGGYFAGEWKQAETIDPKGRATLTIPTIFGGLTFTKVSVAPEAEKPASQLFTGTLPPPAEQPKFFDKVATGIGVVSAQEMPQQKFATFTEALQAGMIDKTKVYGEVTPITPLDIKIAKVKEVRPEWTDKEIRWGIYPFETLAEKIPKFVAAQAKKTGLVGEDKEVEYKLKPIPYHETIRYDYAPETMKVKKGGAGFIEAAVSLGQYAVPGLGLGLIAGQAAETIQDVGGVIPFFKQYPVEATITAAGIALPFIPKVLRGKIPYGTISEKALIEMEKASVGLPYDATIKGGRELVGWWAKPKELEALQKTAIRSSEQMIQSQKRLVKSQAPYLKYIQKTEIANVGEAQKQAIKYFTEEGGLSKEAAVKLVTQADVGATFTGPARYFKGMIGARGDVPVAFLRVPKEQLTAEELKDIGGAVIKELPELILSPDIQAKVSPQSRYFGGEARISVVTKEGEKQSLIGFQVGAKGKPVGLTITDITRSAGSPYAVMDEFAIARGRKVRKKYPSKIGTFITEELPPVEKRIGTYIPYTKIERQFKLTDEMRQALEARTNIKIPKGSKYREYTTTTRQIPVEDLRASPAMRRRLAQERGKLTKEQLEEVFMKRGRVVGTEKTAEIITKSGRPIQIPFKEIAELPTPWPKTKIDPMLIRTERAEGIYYRNRKEIALLPKRSEKFPLGLTPSESKMVLKHERGHFAQDILQQKLKGYEEDPLMIKKAKEHLKTKYGGIIPYPKEKYVSEYLADMFAGKKLKSRIVSAGVVEQRPFMTISQTISERQLGIPELPKSPELRVRKPSGVQKFLITPEGLVKMETPAFQWLKVSPPSITPRRIITTPTIKAIKGIAKRTERTLTAYETAPKIVGGLGLTASAYAGLGLAGEQMEYLRTPSEQIKVADIVSVEVKPKERIKEGVMLIQPPQLRERISERITEERITERPMERITERLLPRIKISERTALRERVAQRLQVREAERVRARTEVTPRITTAPPSPPRPPVRIRIRLPPFPARKIVSPKRKISPSKAYEVFVRRRGKFAPVGVAVPKSEALAIGVKETLGGAAATFQLRPSKRPLQPLGITISPQALTLYRPPKMPQPDTFVQRQRQRIITRGEVKEISLVGAAASAAKRRMKW